MVSASTGPEFSFVDLRQPSSISYIIIFIARLVRIIFPGKLRALLSQKRWFKDVEVITFFCQEWEGRGIIGDFHTCLYIF